MNVYDYFLFDEYVFQEAAAMKDIIKKYDRHCAEKVVH